MADIADVITHLESSGNVELAKVVENFNGTFKTNVERIGNLELDVKTSAEKRDALKTLIRNATGLEAITEEGLKQVLTANKGVMDEILKKENDELRVKLGESANAVDTVAAKYIEQINGLKLERAVTMIGAVEQAKTPHALGAIIAELSKNAVFEGDEIAYKKPDGTTIFSKNGSPAGIQDRFEEMKNDPAFEYLFKDQYKKGGGKAATGPVVNDSGVALRRSKMGTAEKAEYIAKNSLAAYQQLPL